MNRSRGFTPPRGYPRVGHDGEVGIDDPHPLILQLACRKEAIPYDGAKYKGRNKVERLFNKPERFRRIATRYDKLDLSFLEFIYIRNKFIMIQ